MITENLAKQFPLPWTTRKVIREATRTCHHKASTWAFFDAEGKRVFMSESICGELLHTINEGAPTRVQKKETDLELEWL